MDVLQQWKQGVVYPRWAALSHWGYGEARFIFYPPVSWTLGAVLSAILPWKMVPAAYCWIILTFAALCMYKLARRWLPPSDALFAAVFYALNPYHLLIVYWRSAYGELLAAIILPLMLLYMLRLVDAGPRPMLWLSFTLAAAWLFNIPAALMIHYSAAGLALFISLRERSSRPLIKTAAALLLGAGLASFFLIPAIYEQPWVNISTVLSPGVRPVDNFLFTTVDDPDHNRFNLLISLVASAEIAVVVISIWFVRRKQHENSSNGLLLSLWGAAIVFVMFPVSNVLWEHLPEFRFIQLPFRWLLCLGIPLTILFTLATAQGPQSFPANSSSPDRRSSIRRWSARVFVLTLLIATVVISGRYTQPPWWDNASDIKEMSDAISDGTGYEGSDEYVPIGGDPYELNKALPQVSDGIDSAANTQILEWSALEKHFTMRSTTPQNLTVRLFNYPAWKVTVNGKPVEAQSSDVTGLIVVPVPAGNSDVRIVFRRTFDCLAGAIVSLFCLALCIFLLARLSIRSRPAGITP